MLNNETWATNLAVGAGVVCTVAVLGLSMRMNYLLGVTLAVAPAEAMLFGLVSLAADGLKAVLPVVIARQFRAGQWGRMAVGAALFLLVLGYGFMSALGFAAQGRAEMLGGRQKLNAGYAEATADLMQAEAQRLALGKVRIAGQVEGDLSMLRREGLWTASKQCTRGAGAAAREFCQRYDALVAEKAVVAEAAVLDAKLENLKVRRNAAREAGGMQEARDYQVLALTWLMADNGKLGIGLSWWLAVLVEAVSAFGLLAILQARREAAEKVEAPEPAWRLAGEAQAEGDLCHG